MRLRDEDSTLKTTAIKIVLIGNKQDLDNFSQSCPFIGFNIEENLTLEKGSQLTCYYQKVKIDKECYQLWHLDQERLFDQEFFERTIDGAKGFIYFNLTKEQLVLVEKYRDAGSCIAIDFFVKNLKPLDWLKSIKNLCSIQPQVVELFNQNLVKAMIVKNGQAKTGISFFGFPQDLKNYISLLMLMSDILVPSICCKPVYVGLPSEMLEQELLIELKQQEIEVEAEVDENCCSCSLI